MSKYDKGYQQVTREEEGLYHERVIEPAKPRSYTTRSKEIVPVTTTATSKYDHSSGDEDNFQEWTSTKKKVHHKTRQVETRVSRQLLVEDGKVIADSGPQVVTRIKEDDKVEECERERAPKNKGKFEAIENAPEGESQGRVLGEKKEIQRKSREIREENMQYHDERYKELTGRDMHQRAIKAPHELITINDQPESAMPRGKMVHYSNRGKKYEDTDEILEVAKMAIDGSITKEVTRKKHHEEFSEDEKPDEKGEAEQLRHKPVVQRSSRRGVDYVNDFDNISDPIHSGDDADDAGGRRGSQRHRSAHRSAEDDEAFPRYQLDPLLNSLRDEDFKPATSKPTHESSHRSAATRPRQHRLLRTDHSDSDSDQGNSAHYNKSSSSHHHHHTNARPYSPHFPQATGQRHDDTPAVEIPEEYRHHKERLLSSKGKPTSHLRERSFSPASKSHLSHRSSKSHRSHKEDASVQAHLTDEEEERKSLRSSSSSSVDHPNSHAKQTKQLQRQSTVNSQRNYYYGKQRSPASVHSYSSSSLDDPKERLRENGARSKDSGFKSPHSMRTGTPTSGGSQQQIYSVSNKSKKNRQELASRDRGGVSPTPSAGQRSVKTTTTTMSAGLTDRPLSRGERAASQPPAARQTSGKLVSSRPSGRRESANTKGNSSSSQNDDYDYICDHYRYGLEAARAKDQGGRRMPQRQRLIRPKLLADKDVQCSMDEFHSRASGSLRGPAATTIQVPYRRETVEQANGKTLARDRQRQMRKDDPRGKDAMIEETGGEMRLEEDIAKLRQRLENINSQTITVVKGRRKKAAATGGHFDYKTVVANVQPLPVAGRHTVDAYNVRVIQHDSPFCHNVDDGRQLRSVGELSNSIAQLELLSSDLGSSSSGVGGSTTNTNQFTPSTTRVMLENNNEASFNLDDYVKHRAVPIITRGNKGSDSLELDADEEDRVSLVSSCSLRSSRTYDVRYVNQAILGGDEVGDDDDLNDEKHFPVGQLDLDEMGDEKKPAAWIYDIRDGSSKAIVAPPKPERPEPPKVDAKELAQSRGGRSYYLELIDPTPSADRKENKSNTRDSQGTNSSLYSRWSSQGALSSQLSNSRLNYRSPQRRISPSVKPAQVPKATSETRKSRQILPASIIYHNQRPSRPLSSSSNTSQLQLQQQPASNGPALGARSKSSSCLASSTRPTKYSIYGGLRKPNDDNKPVPRLSYSRAIGPKSQRQIDAQSKTPSRYLKMK